jgi:16S rRNA (guanine527-N7)-methyltransferase
MKDADWPCEKLLEDTIMQLGVFGTIAAENPPAAFCAIERVSYIRQKLLKYIEEIELFNEAYGLVKVKDRGSSIKNGREELIVKHILDSLSPLKIITRLLEESSQTTSPAWQLGDVGSGAGLPGIPLAICLPHAEFTLIERMGRRAGFLRDCIAVLGLRNVRVEEKEMEKAASGRFDLAVFRAFRPLEPGILKQLLRLLKPSGFLAAWKGRPENAREEMMAVTRYFPGLVWEIIPLAVPLLEEERCLTVIKAII